MNKAELLEYSANIRKTLENELAALDKESDLYKRIDDTVWSLEDLEQYLNSVEKC